MSTDKADMFMTIEFLEQILSRSDNPPNLSAYVVNELHRLVGARQAVLLERSSDPHERLWQCAASCPDRQRAAIDKPALHRLATTCIDAIEAGFHSSTDATAAGGCLLEGNWANVLLLPLGGGTSRQGMILLFDITDTSQIQSLLASLEPVRRLIDQVVRNAMLHASLEETIEYRATQLAASELRFRTLTETAPVGVYQTDAEDHFIFVNGMWSDISGLSALDANGTNWLAAIHPEDRQRIAAQWKHCRDQGQPMTVELRYLRPDSSIVWVLQQASPVYDPDGGISGYVGTVTNISDRIRHEQALRTINEDLERRVQARTAELSQTNQDLQAAMEQSQRLQEAIIVKEKLASLTPMVAGVSHELNTPIGNIAVLSSALQERLHELLRDPTSPPDPNELRTFLNYIEKSNEMVMKSATFAGTLVQSFKKVVVDREGAQRRAFRLSELVDDCFNIIRPSFKRHPWTMVNQVSLDIELNSYPGALGQVIDNLVRNAFIHGFEGRSTGQVQIHAEAMPPAGNRQDPWIRILVTDDGKGIPFKLRHKIFDPFFTTQLGSGGSGLGLSITYNLIQQVLGGDISVKSQSIVDGSPAAESGTTFIIEIPCERRD